MVDPVETAQDQIGEAHEERGEKRTIGRGSWPSAVSFLAAGLAIVDLGAKSSQTEYITRKHQRVRYLECLSGEKLRASLWNAEALLAGEPGERKRSRGPGAALKKSHSEEARMRDEPASGDGMKQLREKAKALEEEREKAFHSYHGYEHTASVLEISIVLASVSVVTRVHVLGIVASVIGLLACGYGLAVLAHFA